jgi:hypothetical protein
LRSKGLEAKHTLKKPATSAVNKRKRLEFAKRHEQWTTADWSRNVWSDETKINRFSSDGRLWCWQATGEALSDRTIQARVKHEGHSVMVCGCMMAHDVGDITRIEGTMNADVYCTNLDQNLIRTIDKYSMEKREVIFQHDS